MLDVVVPPGVKALSKRCKPSKKFNLTSWKLECEGDWSVQACVRGSVPMRRLISLSSQPLLV